MLCKVLRNSSAIMIKDLGFSPTTLTRLSNTNYDEIVNVVSNKLVYFLGRNMIDCEIYTLY